LSKAVINIRVDEKSTVSLAAWLASNNGERFFAFSIPTNEFNYSEIQVKFTSITLKNLSILINFLQQCTIIPPYTDACMHNHGSKHFVFHICTEAIPMIHSLAHFFKLPSLLRRRPT
jgi:hypothetical protein